MKIKYLRLVDKYIGFLLAAFLCIFKPFSKRKDSSNTVGIEKILVIKFWGFGSIICAYDFFQLVRRKFPHGRICVLTLKQNSEIFKITGLFDEIYTLNLTNLASFTLDTIKIINRLRKLSFDISFDLEFTSRFSAIVSSLVNAKKRIGFQYDGVFRGGNYTDIMHFREDAKLKSSVLKMFDYIGSGDNIISEPLKLNISEEESKALLNLLKSESLLDIKPIVGINVNASELCLLRRWPPDYFVLLTEKLIEEYSSHIIFIGSKDDRNYVDSVVKLVDQGKKTYIHDFSGKISLTQLAYLMSRLNLFISNDSGPLHLAAYLNVPTVSFFGPETPIIYGPEGKADVVFYKQFSCSPCIRAKNYKVSKCIDNRCLKTIIPEEVLGEIRRKKLL